jgi:hypothetical protein
MSSLMELMKSVAIQQMHNDAQNNGSSLANQFMNQLSQQQAQKAREQEMMQKFLMQRQMKKEDFERQVELGKFLKKDKDALLAEAKMEKEQEKMEKRQEAMYKKAKPVNDELAKAYVFTKTSVDVIDEAIPELNSPAFRSAQGKLKKRISETTGLHKFVESWVTSDTNKATVGMDKIAEQVSNLIKEEKLTPEEVDALTTATNAMKDTTNSLIQSRKQKQGLGTFNVNLSTKYNAFLNSPESLIEGLKQNREEFEKRYIEEHKIAKEKSTLYGFQEMSLAEKEEYDPKKLKYFDPKASNVLMDSPDEQVNNELQKIMNEKTPEEEINSLSPREKQYFQMESEKKQKNPEQILEIIKRNRNG